MPALIEAQQISSKAAGAGFDWENISQVVAKVHEELAELESASEGKQQKEIESEIGDLLFTIVNLARFLNVDPEQALRATNAKFRRRFAQVEKGLAERGKSFSQTTLDEMEALWQEAKSL
jgi:MazG family protein